MKGYSWFLILGYSLMLTYELGHHVFIQDEQFVHTEQQYWSCRRQRDSLYRRLDKLEVQRFGYKRELAEAREQLEQMGEAANDSAVNKIPSPPGDVFVNDIE